MNKKWSLKKVEFFIEKKTIFSINFQLSMDEKFIIDCCGCMRILMIFCT